MSAVCQQCGACCRWPIIEVEYLDVLREPRIAVEGQAARDNADLPPDEHVWILSPRPSGKPGKTLACPFLDDSRPYPHRCKIYPTRPNACVAFEPDGDKCREVRRLDAGLDNEPEGGRA